jgi:riboflavin synthase
MFTGIITAIGTLDEIQKDGDWRLKIRTSWACDAIDLGASIACSGVCLTVIDRADDWFSVEVSAETLSRSVIGSWQLGTRINLERALKLGDELGGHIVSGHVDGLAKIVSITPSGDSHQLEISVPQELAKYIAEKGSVALDGVSLTVNQVQENLFGVNIIDHTWTHTTFGASEIGQRLNLEIDMLARYVSRLMNS